MFGWRCLVSATILLSELLAFSAAAQAPEEPFKVYADSIRRDGQTGIVRAKGDVEIKRGDMTVCGDRLKLNETDRTGFIEGNVKLTTPEVEIDSSRINLNIDTHFGTMEDAKGKTKDGLFFSGKKIQRVSKDYFLIWKGTFTTCEEEDPAWIFKSSFASLKLDSLAWFRSVSLRLYDIPVAYLPIWASPTVSKRTTGFLGPDFGFSSTKGTYLKNTFFWAISDSSDASLYLDYMDMRGLRQGLEYRYAFAERTRGQWSYNYIYDRKLGENLWNMKYQHRQKFKNGADSRARFDYESDTSYSREFGSGINLFSMRYTDSYASFTKNLPGTALSLTVRDQRSIESATKRRFTRQPEIRLARMSREFLGTPFVVDLPVTAVSFKDETKLEAMPKTENTINRININPTLSLPFSPSVAFNFMPFVSYRVAHYSRTTAETDKPVTVEYYTAGASLEGPRVYKIFGSDQAAFKHTITPKLNYSYVPGYELDGEDRQRIYKIDSLDNSNPASNVTFSILQRVIGKSAEEGSAGRQLLRFDMSQSYDFNLANKRDTPPEEKRPYSLLRLDLDSRPFKWLLLNTDLTHDYYTGMDESFNQEVGLALGKGLNISYDRRYTREPEAVSSKGLVSLKLLRNLVMEVSAIHDDLNGTYSNSMVEAKYNAGCWGFAVSAEGRRRVAELTNGAIRDEWENRFFLVVSLRGVGESGAKPNPIVGKKL